MLLCSWLKVPIHHSTHFTRSRSLALGAKVIAAAGSPAKLDICKRYGGADYVVDYTSPDWQKQVMEITEGRGVDVVFDPVGRIQGKYTCNLWRTSSDQTCRLVEMHSIQRQSIGDRFCRWWHREGTTISMLMSIVYSLQPLAALEPGVAQEHQYCGSVLGPVYTCVTKV